MLANLGDYTVRYGDPTDAAQVQTDLNDASSLVQHVAGQHILRVVDDVWTGEGDDSDLLQLPELPVESVSQVDVDGVTLDTATWRLLERGQIRRLWGCWSTRSLIDVTHTRGYVTVPSWIVSLVCAMVQRAVRPESLAGVSQQTTGGQSVAFAVTAAGATIWVTSAEQKRLRSVYGPRMA